MEVFLKSLSNIVGRTSCYLILTLLIIVLRERKFAVTIKLISQANMLQLRELLAGKQVDNPPQALKIIDIVLRELASQRCISFFAISLSWYSIATISTVYLVVLVFV